MQSTRRGYHDLRHNHGKLAPGLHSHEARGYDQAARAPRPPCLPVSKRAVQDALASHFGSLLNLLPGGGAPALRDANADARVPLTHRRLREFLASSTSPGTVAAGDNGAGATHQHADHAPGAAQGGRAARVSRAQSRSRKRAEVLF